MSCFELALAHRRGRLNYRYRFVSGLLWRGRFDVELLPLTPAIAARAVELPEIHRDPFDRIIIATALEMDTRLASVDRRFANYTDLAGRLIAQ